MNAQYTSLFQYRKDLCTLADKIFDIAWKETVEEKRRNLPTVPGDWNVLLASVGLKYGLTEDELLDRFDILYNNETTILRGATAAYLVGEALAQERGGIEKLVKKG